MGICVSSLLSASLRLYSFLFSQTPYLIFRRNMHQDYNVKEVLHAYLYEERNIGYNNGAGTPLSNISICRRHRSKTAG